MSYLKSHRMSMFTMMANTVLFGVGAGLVGYCWLKFSIHTPVSDIGSDSWWTSNEKLLLATIALLLGGFFHSVVILYPQIRKRDEAINSGNRVNEELRHQALNDPLTGIYNRRYFDEALKSYLAEFNSVGAGMGLMILDLDHFKQINDSYGHSVGDQVLKCVAEKLKENTRIHDVVARVGGEEFAIITYCSDREQLVKIAERYRTAISDCKLQYGNIVVRPTVSIGIATNQEACEADDLYQFADARLYRAKKNGRNQISA